jgi:hypothetical protein
MSREINITGANLLKFSADVSYPDQTIGIKIRHTEQVADDSGQYHHARDIPNTKLEGFFVHPDLLNLFRRLSDHLAYYAEYIESIDPDEEDRADKTVYATGFQMVGARESAGIQITGFKVLHDGNKLSLGTPSILFDGAQYHYAHDLGELASELVQEVHEAYVHNKGKLVQTKMKFPDDQGEGGTDDDDPFASPSGKVTNPLKSVKGMTVTVLKNPL